VVAVKLAAYPPEGAVTDGGAVTALLLLTGVTTRLVCFFQILSQLR